MHCERTEGPKREDERTTFLSEGERENEEERAQKRRKGGNFPKGSAEEELADVPLFGSNRAQVDLSEWNCTATEEKKKVPFSPKKRRRKPKRNEEAKADLAERREQSSSLFSRVELLEHV